MTPPPYDLLVVGGGVTGAGIARDAALRGLKVALLERAEPGGATTAASTHLIHGGVRYLLYDRLTTHASCLDSGLIVRSVPRLATRLPILWPVYRDHARGLETVETLLEEYDRFQPMKEGRPHLRLSAQAALRLMPGLRAEGLRGALVFDEWWVDAQALAARNLESAVRSGARAFTHRKAESALIENGRVAGMRADGEEFRARLTVNAAGPWAEQIASLAGAKAPLRLIKGTHLIWENKDLVPFGLLLEAEDRERYVFVIPSPLGTWVGPTDLPAPEGPDALRSSQEEIGYLSRSLRRYFPSWPERHDRTMIGARPIIGQPGKEKRLSRDFNVLDHERQDGVPGLITVAGGKMSDYRAMAEAATDLACRKLGLPRPCLTRTLALDGKPLENVRPWPGPSARLRRFLRSHPLLREMHALAYLGAAFGRHLARRAAGHNSAADESEFLRHYA